MVDCLNFVSTKDVFVALDKKKKYRSLVNVNHVFDCLLYHKPMEKLKLNDLTPYILQVNPKLKDIYQKAINDYGKENYVFFTGSGSSIVLLRKRYK